MAIPLLPNFTGMRKAVGSVFNRGKISSSVFSGSNSISPQQFNQISQEFIEYRQQNQESISTIQQQIVGLQNQVANLSNGISNIAILLQQDTETEQQLLNQQLSKERLYSIQRGRTERENKLEEGLQKALSEPVKKAQAKVEGIFSRIGKALQYLFFGFLTTQTLKLLDAWKKGDKEKINEIGWNITKNIGYVIAAFAAWKLGLTIIMTALRKALSGIFSLLTRGIKSIFNAAFRSILNILKDFGKKLLPKPRNPKPSTAPSKVKTPPRNTPGTISTKGNKTMKDVVKGSKGPGAAKPSKGSWWNPSSWGKGAKSTAKSTAKTTAKKGFGKAIAKKIPLLGLVLGGAFAVDRLTKGDFTGAGLELASGAASTIPGWGTAASIGLDATIMGRDISMENDNFGESSAAKVMPTETIFGEKETTEQNLNPPSESPSEPTETILGEKETTEQNLKSPSESFVPFTGENVLGDMKENESMENFSNFEKPMPMDFSNVYNSSKNMNSDLISSSKEKIKTPQSVPPLEDPTPNVIVSTIPSGSPSTDTLGIKGSSTKVPMIKTSNPDNFYVLYSKLMYNVVV